MSGERITTILDDLEAAAWSGDRIIIVDAPTLQRVLRLARLANDLEREQPRDEATLPPKRSLLPGLGQSPVEACLPVLVPLRRRIAS